jgi:biotin carboxyl carrier protein
MKVSLTLDGVAYEVVVDRKKGTVAVDGESFPLHADGVRLLAPGRAVVAGREVAYALSDLDLLAGEAGSGASGPTKVRPPMSGKLESVKVGVGQAVAKGDVLFVLEAMKMLNEVRSPSAGTVTAVHLKPGATLETNQVVLELGPTT